jgi:hypothetical protein
MVSGPGGMNTAEGRVAGVRWWRFGALVSLAVLCVPVVTVIMVVTHEVGHTVAARLLGDTHARFLLYGHACIGCNLYNSARLTPWGNVAVSLGGVLFTALLTVAAVVVLAWRGRPPWLPRWLLAEVVVICYGGDLVWQFIQAVQQLPVPAREPLGWGLGYTDLDAATSFGSQATGWSHETVAAVGFTAAALYTVALAAAIRRAWRHGVRAGGPELRPATGAAAVVPGEPPPG